jgi:hypothetical protein
MPLQSTRSIPCSARRKRSVHINMARRAGTKPCPMETMSITSWMDGCTIPMVLTATTMGRYSWPDGRRGLRAGSGSYSTTRLLVRVEGGVRNPDACGDVSGRVAWTDATPATVNLCVKTLARMPSRIEPRLARRDRGTEQARRRVLRSSGPAQGAGCLEPR